MNDTNWQLVQQLPLLAQMFEGLVIAALIPLAFQPGEKWSYSNPGYMALSVMISKVTGKFYGDFIQERIFKPLGMNTTRIISEADIVPNRAVGYRHVKGELKNQDWVSPVFNTTADGSLYFTAFDMAKWDAALYGEKILKKSSLDQMWAAVRLNNSKTHPYGFGWSLGEVRGRRIVEHSGHWQGFTSHIARYVDDKLTVVVFANLAYANGEKIVRGVAAIYNAELTPPPTSDHETQIDFGKLEEVILAELKETNTPGAAFGIVKGEKLIFAKGFGVSNIETGAPVTPEMLFRLASVTNQNERAEATTYLALKEVQSAAKAFIKAFNNLDWEQFRNSFADDATVFFPTATMAAARANGRTEIEAIQSVLRDSHQPAATGAVALICDRQGLRRLYHPAEASAPRLQ